MGRADRYVSGEWNFFCDLCGKKEKSSRGTKTWDGHWVCMSHKEVRNPQDFVKGVKDDQSVPWSRVEAPDTFVLSCTAEGITAIPALAMPGCMTPGRPWVDVGGLFSFCTLTSGLSRADVAAAGCATVGKI